MLSNTLKKLAKRNPEEMDEIRHDLASKKTLTCSERLVFSKGMKKLFFIFSVIFLSLLMFIVVPFIFYLLSQVFYSYIDFLSKYFEPDSVKLLVFGSASLAISIIYAFLSTLDLFIDD